MELEGSVLNMSYSNGGIILINCLFHFFHFIYLQICGKLGRNVHNRVRSGKAKKLK